MQGGEGRGMLTGDSKVWVRGQDGKERQVTIVPFSLSTG